MNYRISGGMLLCGATIEKKDLLLRDGKIEAILPPDAECTADYKVIDCTGCYVSSGFVETENSDSKSSSMIYRSPTFDQRIYSCLLLAEADTPVG